MIPDFLDTGLLPLGIHWAAWQEIEARYGQTARRQWLLSGLKRAVQSLTFAGCPAIYLDGSFVTAKPEPGDYDVAWEMMGVDFAKLDPVFGDFDNFRAAQKAKYRGEFFPASAVAEQIEPFRTFLKFFQADKETGDGKGIIGLRLK